MQRAPSGRYQIGRGCRLPPMCRGEGSSFGPKSPDVGECIDPAESAHFTPLMHMPERAFSWQALGEGAYGCRS